jgi:diaminopimelate epimerase
VKTIPFYKMSGAGNDFIIIDNRHGIAAFDNPADFARKVCQRKMSVGADGLFLLENSDKADFKWHFFNADGSMAEMCGNGARCVSRFAYLTGMTGDRLSFETLAGIISASVNGDQVKVKMTDPQSLALDRTLVQEAGTLRYSFVNTGVPHVVIDTEDIRTVPVVALGRAIRHHQQFAPAGTNVNFIAPLDTQRYAIRTYERGVEDETLACGTGNTAAALVVAARTGLGSPITLQTHSGTWLKVHFSKTGGQYKDVYLEGDARVIFVGKLSEEAWRY